MPDTVLLNKNKNNIHLKNLRMDTNQKQIQLSPYMKDKHGNNG